MKERPILFSAPMVRAILDGTKTQTRRAMSPQPANGWHFETPPSLGRITSSHPKRDRFGVFLRRGLGTDFPELDLAPCPYGQPGDRLWVRETWRHTANSLEEARPITEDITSGSAIDWRATYIKTCMKELGFTREQAEMADDFEHWRPSIHMPRWASRILLEVTGVRVERLQDISEADAIAEGIERRPSADGEWAHYADTGLSADAIGSYRSLWEQINGPGSWESNPWVWVVEFRRIKP